MTVALALALAALSALLAVSAGQGSPVARGGNHGCNQATGKFWSDHFFPAGDNIVFAYVFEEGPTPRGPIGGDEETLVAENTETGGLSPSSLSCGADPGTWEKVLSRLGPGADSVRLDAVGLQGKYQNPEPLPNRINALLSGGRGADTLRGHNGFDEELGGGGTDELILKGGRDLAKAGGGDDLVRAVDGRRDKVQCGDGDDKAFVDPRDDTAGCERVVER